MTTRLPWQRNPAGGFIAYPEGEARKTRHAEIHHDGSFGTGKWRWRALYDGSVIADGADTQQEAADRVTAAWPTVKAKAAALADKDAAEAALRTMVRRQCARGDLSVSVFSIAESGAERLTHIIWLVKEEKGLDGPAKQLVEACSAELFRRRTASP